MLTFYYSPLSPNSRRVWLTLLEKQLTFEPVVLQLNGDQLTPEFETINPFHHVPVLVDDGTKLIESLAILDYLNAKYPAPSLLPTDSRTLAQVRMVQFLTVNELMPSLMLHIYADTESPHLTDSKTKLGLTLEFLADLLQDAPFFGGERLTVADIVAGTVIPLLRRTGVALGDYGHLQAWCDRIQARPAWQTTALSDEGWHEFQRRIQVMARRRQRANAQTALKPIIAKHIPGEAA